MTIEGLAISVAPSLSVIVLGFEIADDAGMAIQRVAAQPHEATIVDDGHALNVIGAEEVATRAVESARRDLHRVCTEWMGAHLPGAFANGLAETRPVADLVTARAGHPFCEQGSQLPFESILRLRSPMTWIGQADSGLGSVLRLLEPDRFRDPPMTLRFGGREDVLYGALRELGGVSAEDHGWALFRTADTIISRLLGLASVPWALQSFSARLSTFRDLPSPKARRITSTLDRLAEAQQQIRMAVDAHAIAVDLASPDLRWTDWCTDLKMSAPEFPRADGRQWIEGQKHSIHRDVAALRRVEEHVREQQQLESGLLSGAASLRAQRSVFWLSVFVAGLTVATVVLAILSLTQ